MLSDLAPVDQADRSKALLSGAKDKNLIQIARRYVNVFDTFAIHAEPALRRQTADLVA